MEKVLREKIINLHKDFINLDKISKSKMLEIQDFKKSANVDFTLEETVTNYSNLVADFNLITRDSQIVFTELFSITKLYLDLNLEKLPTELLEFYNQNEVFYPKRIFVVKDEGIVEKEEGVVQKERDKFLKSDYLKSLINAKA